MMTRGIGGGSLITQFIATYLQGARKMCSFRRDISMTGGNHTLRLIIGKRAIGVEAIHPGEGCSVFVDTRIKRFTADKRSIFITVQRRDAAMELSKRNVHITLIKRSRKLTMGSRDIMFSMLKRGTKWTL
jgi:hypothetical protein